MNTIWTIGHSTHSIDKFISILQSFDIQTLADIRSMPGSRRYPQFNQAAFRTALSSQNIAYIHLPDLGGRRKTLPNAGKKPFGGYIAHIQTDEFFDGISQLQHLARSNRVAYMCAEANWWQCHRSLVSDYLRDANWQVCHIIDEHKSTLHPQAMPTLPVQGSLF